MEVHMSDLDEEDADREGDDRSEDLMSDDAEDLRSEKVPTQEDERDDSEEQTLDELNHEADIAADYIEGLLDILDYDGDIELGVRNGRPLIQIVADDDTDIRRLIGENGEVVEALQRLTRLAVQEKTGMRSRLILDVDGYLTKKRRHLKEMALDACDDVSETGNAVTLPDMNSYERKIVHDVARQEGLKSRSHGVEPHRHVTIYLPKAEREEISEDDADDIDDESVEDEVDIEDSDDDEELRDDRSLDEDVSSDADSFDDEDDEEEDESSEDGDLSDEDDESADDDDFDDPDDSEE
jgi:spoIIIJ-associated protein